MAGESLPLLIVADRQTAGRGRGENRWWTGAGSLAFSLVFDPESFHLERPARPARSLAAGVALIDAVAPLAPGERLGLHWPNDVFVDGKKLAGILIDVLPSGRHILGIGINTNNSLAGTPEEVRRRAVSLGELCGRTIDHTLLLCDFCGQLRAALRMCEQDPPDLGRRFQELCLQIGSQLTVDSGSVQTCGRCLGIQGDGALLLETDQGIARIYSGALRHA